MRIDDFVSSLVKVANGLDDIGMRKEANKVDRIIEDMPVFF